MTPDIAIVGGGPAGLTMAGLLERAGIDFIVYEREAFDTPPRGGCLDLHEGSGQRALIEAGAGEGLKKYGRLGDATIHKFYDHNLNSVFAFGEGRNAPELDRTDIKKALLAVIPAEKVKWRKELESSKRNDKGEIVLTFKDGSTASGFKLVIGADGIWSKVRPLVTSTEPKYSGQTILTTHIWPSNPIYPNLEKLASKGPMCLLGRGTFLWCQRQGNESYHFEMGFRCSPDFLANGLEDLEDLEGIRKLMLSNEYYGKHTEQIKELIRAMEGPFRTWPLYFMPPKHLNWSPQRDVTLIGDAAHTTTPFVGDGVNCALRDTLILIRKLKEYGITDKAVAEYEKEMFPHAIDVIERSLLSGTWFFDWNSPETFIDNLKEKPILGTTDSY